MLKRYYIALTFFKQNSNKFGVKDTDCALGSLSLALNQTSEKRFVSACLTRRYN